MSIDNGWLRIRPPFEPGWGREVVCYGPYERTPGLAMAALVLNGHNTSHTTHVDEGLRSRLIRWLLGHEQGVGSAVRRLLAWAAHPRRRLLAWRLRWWWHLHPRHELQELDDNLSVGWFDCERPVNPHAGATLVMHAALGDNGELQVGRDGIAGALMHGLQNVPLNYVVVLRETGALYCIGDAIDDGSGRAVLKPVAIDRTEGTAPVYAGVHQGVLGQIGFRADTRVKQIQVSRTDSSPWYGSAVVADRFVGQGPVDGSEAEIGGTWQAVTGTVARTAEGVVTDSGDFALATDIPESAGLVAFGFAGAADAARLALGWEGAGRRSFALALTNGVCDICERDEDTGEETVVRSEWSSNRAWSASHDMQCVLYGSQVCVLLDGVQVLCRSSIHPVAGVPDGTLTLGVTSGGDRMRLTAFEVHPSHVDARSFGLELPVLPVPAAPTRVLADGFAGAVGTPLEKRRCGDQTWRVVRGDGRIALDGRGGARVRATLETPNPGSTLYGIDWHHPDLAELQTTITPPGTARGEGHRGRGGVFFWQDPRNYITVSMWNNDTYDGASLALFTHLDGFEDIYDAVWTMVGSRIAWGQPFRLKVGFDGGLVVVSIGDERVLYRRLTDVYPKARRLAIRTVGLAVNWEWGDDTGTTFSRFEARTGAADAGS